MIRFDCDYLEGAHPAILQRLAETNMDQTLGYGEDPYCAAAAEKIRKACAAPDAAVHFLVAAPRPTPPSSIPSCVPMRACWP